MQSASPDFFTAADASLRKPVGKLEITWSDAYIEPVDSVVVSTNNRGSQEEQVADVRTIPSFKYTLLDGTWALGDAFHLAPETASEVATYQIGYYGNSLSGSSSPYAFGSPITCTVNMSARTIQGVSLVGDSILNEYPTNYTIGIYSGVSLVTPLITETNNTSVDRFYPGVYHNVDKLVLTINNWSAPDTCCKILEFFTSFTAEYTSDDIIDMSLLEEREVRDSTLPIGNISANDLTFTIQNLDYGHGEWIAPSEVKCIKSDVQDVSEWAVYQIYNNGVPSLIDTYICPYSDKTGSSVWYFVYFYTVPGGVSTNDTIQLYFQPTGADIGKPGDFTTDVWTVNDIIYEPYNPDNPTSFFTSFLKPNRRIKAYLGFVLDNGTYEYLPIGTFWNNDWKIDNNKLSITTDCRDRLGLLQDSIYDASPLFVNKTLYYIADAVLTYAKTYIPMNDLTWEIAPELASITLPYAYFEKKSYFDVLKQITEACLGQCYMSKDDVLIIESYDKNLNIDAPTTTLTKDSYYNIAQKYSFIEIINTINVNYFIYSLATIGIIHTTSSISIAASETLEPIVINYSNPALDTSSIAALNVLTGTPTLNKVSEYYYSWGCIIEVEETGGNAGTFEIEVTAQELITDDTITKTTIDQNSIDEFGVMTYDLPDNSLIQSESLAITIGDNLIDTYSSPRSDVTIDYPGNPAIELADTVKATVFKRGIYDILKDFIIYKSELSFNGTLSGRLYGKLQTYAGVLGDTLYDSDGASSLLQYYETDGATEEWYDTDN